LTSHMSRFLIADDFPIKCFNAQNHWVLDWFSDRSITVDPNVPVKVKILGFVDYVKAAQGTEFVVAKVGENIYLQFNRAKLHNRDTEEAPDKLVIILDRGDEGTTLVAELDNVNRLYTVPDFESSGRQLYVVVCRVLMGETDNDIDWMEVSIGYGSVCGAQLTMESAPPPSPRPTGRPMRSPTPKMNTSKQFDHKFSPPSFKEAGDRRFNWIGQGSETRTRTRTPPTRIAGDRLNLIQEEVLTEVESSGTVSLNNLIWYPMTAILGTAALLW
jgi:hypothetical protein